MKRVLLTGANTLVGSHILEQLLDFDLSVRAVVPSKEDAHMIHQLYPRTSSTMLDFAVVTPRNVAVPGAYDKALRGIPRPFDTVIHTLAADPPEEADCLSRLIALQTDNLINFVQSVRNIGTRVERVIIATSLTPFARWLAHPSMAQSPSQTNRPAPQVAEMDTEYVLATSQASGSIVYDALRKWIEDAHASFDLVAVTAPSVYGPCIRPLENSSDLEGANRRIWNICSNDSGEHMTFPPYGIDFFADARDLASAAVQAVRVPQAGNRRFVVSAGTMPSGSVIADFLVRRFPELEGRVSAGHSPPRRPPAEDPPLEFVDPRLSVSILGVRYRRVEDTLTDIAEQILGLQRRKEWKKIIQS